MLKERKPLGVILVFDRTTNEPASEPLVYFTEAEAKKFVSTVHESGKRAIVRPRKPPRSAAEP